MDPGSNLAWDHTKQKDGLEWGSVWVNSSFHVGVAIAVNDKSLHYKGPYTLKIVKLGWG